MKKTFKQTLGRLSVYGLIAMLSLGGISDFLVQDADAARGRSSSSRSGGGFFGGSKKVTKPSLPKRTAPQVVPKRSGSGFGTKPKATAPATKPKLSSADSKLKASAAKSKKSVDPKSAAAKTFASKNKAKYTSTYTTKPTTRPSHIPASYGGHNVGYNSQYGGYGYMDNGSWRMYDAMSDAIMLTAIMNMSQPQVVVAQPVGVSGGHVVTTQRGGGWLLGILFGSLFVIVAIMVFRR
jgi:hypothetical protein